MINTEYSEAITETLDILKYTRKEDIDKISSKFMNFLKENASKTYKPELDHTKKIKDMELKRQTKAILAIIYKNFWCDDNQKKEFDAILNNNEIKYQEELRKKYNSNNIFKSKERKPETVQEPVTMVEYKDSIFIRIKNWFKQIFKT